MSSEYHWIQRFIRRWEFLLDDDIQDGSETVADMVHEATPGDWAALSDEQQADLSERLASLRASMPWADDFGALDETLERWQTALKEADPAHAPLADHWLVRVLAREEEVRGLGEEGRSNALWSLIERAEGADWVESGLSLHELLPDDGTLYHRAARHWPEVLLPMLEAEPLRPVVDSQNRTAYDVLVAQWGPDQFVPIAQALKACLMEHDLQQHLDAPSKPRPGLRL